ncbi:hypothetical protein [Amycolatopsis speibonae]|uniref:Uncharacterized protein n=1 Tax=Amycolatopsis speibonae TaxID=1450224 RepID=A0ABV7PC79_9PSEU
MNVAITAMENVVFEVQQSTTLFRCQRGTFSCAEVTPGDSATLEQRT